ncbi:MAG: hypothetical protein MUQ10_03465 [Anaerolineae bacterium]|nr:hypothetical protein [Anaerolineae bacterium]
MSKDNNSGEPNVMEFGSMPLDPIYAWSIVLEPVDVLIERTSGFIDQLAQESYEHNRKFTDKELAERFLTFFDKMVRDGVLTRGPDAEPAMGRQILGPRRWRRAQRIRMERLIAYWREQDNPR